MSDKDLALASAMLTNVRKLSVQVVECLLKEDRDQSIEAAGATIAQVLAIEAKLSGHNTVEAVAAFQSKWNDVVKRAKRRTPSHPFSLN